MKTGMPVSWTVQKHLEKVREKNWKTAREKEAEKPQKHGGSWRLCPVGKSSQIKKLTEGETKTRKKLDRAGGNTERRVRGKQVFLHQFGEALTLADAEATDPAAVMPRLTAMSPLDVVTATVTGVGRREGMTGRGRSPGRLLPLTTAEAQL